MTDKTTETTITRDVKSGELERKIMETSSTGSKIETNEKTSASG